MPSARNFARATVQANSPTPLAMRLLAVAMRLLPPGDQTRYLEELRAELASIAEAGNSRHAQLAYAARQLVSAWWLRTALHDVRRVHGAPVGPAARLALEQQRLLQERRTVCVALLRTARDFRAAVENNYEYHGENMRARLWDIRQRAADITGQADEVGFLVPGFGAAADALADAASLTAGGAVDPQSLALEASAHRMDTEYLDRYIHDFKSAARAMFDSEPDTTEDPAVD
jgi:hypothetical protein